MPALFKGVRNGDPHGCNVTGGGESYYSNLKKGKRKEGEKSLSEHAIRKNAKTAVGANQGDPLRKFTG